MLATVITLAIALLFTLAGCAAVLAIADSMMKARRAYTQLKREARLIQSGFASQIEVHERRVQRVSVQAMPARRPPVLRQRPACAAA